MTLEQTLKPTRYSKHGGKITSVLPDNSKFVDCMISGKFVKKRHRSYAVLLYYTAIRREEGLRCTPKQFKIQDDRIIFEVGKRLKHGIVTPPLEIFRNKPFVCELEEAIRETKRGERIWPYCSTTAYLIVDRAFGFYPHYFRLNRISQLFKDGWTVAQLHTWTGLTLVALNYYLGLVDISKMAKTIY
jgi:integrase